MSTIDRHGPRLLPPLVAGERLDQPTFHERYEAMPPGTWAELIDGVVYVPSPLRNEHGETDHTVALWIMSYRRATQGLRGGIGCTTILGDDSEVQPDQQMRIDESKGGRTRIVDGYVVGPPELVVELGRASRSYDLGAKKREYERAGILEYVFVGLDPDEVRWFILRDGRFVERPADADGLFRSEVFPGLWLDPGALLEGDLDALIAALERGLATPEHAAFAARLAGA